MALQIDGATPQPVQKMTFDGLLHFVAKQQRLARVVFTCYEAGAFGFHLHRKAFAADVDVFAGDVDAFLTALDARSDQTKPERVPSRLPVIQGR